jgi:hypothetical protein
MCEDAAMAASGPEISIVLTPGQVESVVRAACADGTPGLAQLLSHRPEPGRPSPAAATPRPRGRERERPEAAGRAEARVSQSLLRGLALLRCFDPGGEERGIVALARELGVSPSTAHRYAQTLVDVGLLDRHPRTRKYRLRPAD